MFTRTAQFYDAIYGRKNYAAEVDRLEVLVRQHKQSAGNRLLDVGCGTARHLRLLQSKWEVQGLDLDPGLLTVARQGCPGTTFHLGNMIDFDLGQQFDVVLCLFGSIAYTLTVDNFRRAIATMIRHVAVGGLLIIEPYISPENWQDGLVRALFVDEPDLKIARISVGQLQGEVAVAHFEYLIGTPGRIDRLTERHEFGLFGRADFEAAFSPLRLAYDAEGLIGRGLYIGLKHA